MVATAKDLRFNISQLFDVISKGKDVTITYRGTPKAKLISSNNDTSKKENEMFGMWNNKEIEIDDFIRDIRAGRNFQGKQAFDL